jgi:predicted lipid-binding transport protein (Tim44 family)
MEKGKRMTYTIFHPEHMSILKKKIEKIEEKGFKVSVSEHVNLDAAIITIWKDDESATVMISGLDIMRAGNEFGSLVDKKLGTAIKQWAASI